MSITCKVMTRIGSIAQRSISPSNLKSMGAARFRTNCAKEIPTKASEMLSKYPCFEGQEKGEHKEAGSKKKKSMWENPECCYNPCPDMVPRLDDQYYKASDKLTRKYTQTWVECPKVQIAPKKICCFENVLMPPFERRPLKPRKKGCTPNKTDLMPCSRFNSKKCPRLQLANCKEGRVPPKCKKERAPSGCNKVCTPYPSFSECIKDKKKPRRQVECTCLNDMAMCEVWAEWRRRRDYGITN